MMARRSGRILNVASIAAYQPSGPQQAVYYATKSFVLSGVVIPGAIAKAMAVVGELPSRRIAFEVNQLLLKSASNAA
jgi:NAD(P)-dependent dehydrogenase (short-subunit alcohol dehydrogenase family)